MHLVYDFSHATGHLQIIWVSQNWTPILTNADISALFAPSITHRFSHYPYRIRRTAMIGDPLGSLYATTVENEHSIYWVGSSDHAHGCDCNKAEHYALYFRFEDAAYSQEQSLGILISIFI